VLNLDPAKLLVIAVVAVILLGPDKLPQVARQVGAAWHAFGEFRHKMESEVRSSIPDLPSSADIARLARSPSALLDHLSKMDGGTDPAGSTGVPAGSAAVPTGSAAAPAASPSANGATSVTSEDTVRDESPLTGVPAAAPDTVPPVSRPMPTPQPPHTPDPSLN
jgi:sec-independent protein translocase protein TatB